MIRVPARNSVLFDAIVALGCAVFLGLPTLLFTVTNSFVEGLWHPVVSILLVAIVALRRFSPPLTLLAALLLSLLHVVALQLSMTPIWFSVLVLLYTVGRYSRGAERWIGVVAAILGAMLAALGVVTPADTHVSVSAFAYFSASVASALLFLTSWLLGIAVSAVLDARAASADRLAALHRERQAAERAYIEEERVAIARDMHDVVAHSLAVVIAQANGARYTQDAEQKDAVLATIAQTAGSALGDVRMLLSRLRHAQAEDPNASIVDLPDMVERMRSAGLDVQFEVFGVPEPLPKTAEIAAYRICQEALTNALRHGDTAQPVHLRVRWDRGLEINVYNRVRAASGIAGHGITGMRERASIAGGTSWIGIDDGWFRVSARFAVPPVGKSLPPSSV